MKVSSKLTTLLFVIVLALVGISPAVFAGGPNDDSSLTESIDGYPIPEEIGGLPVIFVHTSDNTAWLQPGEVCIALLDITNDAGVPLSTSSVPEYMSNLPEGWSITVFGGSDVSKEEYIRLHKEANEFYEKNGPGPKSYSVIIASSDNTEAIPTPP